MARRRVTALRKYLNNYSQLARDTGLSVSHVSRVLRGLRNPTLGTAKRIADAANMSIDELQRYIDYNSSRSA